MARPKKIVEEIDLFGFKIRPNSMYYIESRPDPSSMAVDFDKQNRKLETKGVFNGKNIPFKNGQYDTGLVAHSPIYRGIRDKESLEPQLEFLKHHIVEPFERMTGEVGVLEGSNFDFWDKFFVKLSAKQPINTGTPEGLLRVFLAVLHKMVVPPGKEGDPRWQRADYLIKDNAASATRKEQLEMAKAQAYITMSTLGKDSTEDLISIMGYAGVKGLVSKMTLPALINQFNYWVDKQPNHIDYFQDAVELYGTKTGKEVLKIFNSLLTLKNKSKLEVQKNSYYYNGLKLDKSLKLAAKKIHANKEFEKIKDELIMM